MSKTMSSKAAAMLETMTTLFSKYERLSLDAAAKLGKLLDQADDEAILVLANANVRFVTVLARRRAVDRGLVKLPSAAKAVL